jgi:hypothetical protein
MTYRVDAGTVQVVAPSASLPNGFSVPVWDQWVVELATGRSRLLQAGLVHCGGCDGRFGEEWSKSGRLLFFAESRSGGSTFVSDMQTGVTRKLFSGSTEISVKPDWSPAADMLVYRSDDGVSVVEDFTSGTRTELPELGWPVRFDPSGIYLYSPAWDDDRKGAVGETKVYDVQARRVIATLPGRPRPEGMWLPLEPVKAADGTFIVILERAADCDGVAVYRDQKRVACIVGGQGGSFSPDGKRAVVARAVVPPALGQSGQYEIVLVDTAGGQTRTLYSVAGLPELIWNNASSHLLVLSPFGGRGP